MFVDLDDSRFMLEVKSDSSIVGNGKFMLFFNRTKKTYVYKVWFIENVNT